ncbi:hypothetical protein [Streptococcus sp. SN-1]|uniref:hypothetical protein n=1 Tax=Streptococcus sp. SN-1 TaxID=3074854 RepID=UPI0034E865AB
MYSTLGASVSLVIVVVADAVKSSVAPVVGFVTCLVCVTVTFPVGSRPLLSANSSAPNATLVAPAGTVFGISLLPILKVTVAPGVTFVTVIPRFGRPPVFVT